MELIIPKRYKLKLLPETTEIAIKFIKDSFQERLAKRLNLRRVTAPLFVLSGTGLNDDLNGVEHAVGFDIKAMGNRHAEVVHSLAKWKRTTRSLRHCARLRTLHRHERHPHIRGFGQHTLIICGPMGLGKDNNRKRPLP